MNPNTVFAIATAPKRNSRHWKQSTITWGEILDWVKKPDDIKESGNYLLGTLKTTTVQHPHNDRVCTNLHRRKDAIVSRSVIALDVDTPGTGLPEQMELLFEHCALVHTTFSSSPDDPRYRILVPTDREMTPDEYIIASTTLIKQLGEDQFDPGTTQPERYMFRPAAQEPGWFDYWVIDGDPIAVDELLDGAQEFEEDLSTKPMPAPNTKKRDPFEMDGVVGAFNRAYEDIQVLIEEYDLPYETAGEDRWHLVGSRSVAGMGIVTAGIVYSHHVNDPAFGKACTAFDLVRLHRFGELDESANPQTPINRLPSNDAMLDLASLDARVIAELVGVDFAADMDDTTTASDWKLRLRFSPRSGKLIDEMSNWDQIVVHEPVFRGLYYNELNLSVETSVDLPWRPRSRGGVTFSATDRTALTHHIEREFRFRPPKQFCDGLVDVAAQKRSINPIRDYLDNLVWDGEERLETCLPGVRPTTYTRLVARKSLVAAVARIYEPGVKWDHSLVLFGSEGIGKSFWIDQMSRGYSASLGKIGDKDTLITMQRSWIMISDEGHSLRKADSDEQKEFLTRREDIFRLPYEREAQAHPRHCVIWSTTNDEVFLRRQEGNRRFLVVHCEERADFDKLKDDYVDQVWAEAVYLYRAGELLFLEDSESSLAAGERESFIEEDALGGLLHEFLETPVPDNWEDLTPEGRQMWLLNRSDGIVPVGENQIGITCSAQLWVEALNQKIGDHKRTDLLEITKSLRRLGWIPLPGRRRVNGYGPQVLFQRPTDEDLI